VTHSYFSQALVEGLGSDGFKQDGGIGSFMTIMILVQAMPTCWLLLQQGQKDVHLIRRCHVLAVIFCVGIVA
jgi:hypothetical protein